MNILRLISQLIGIKTLRLTGIIYSYIKENMTCQNSNGRLRKVNNRIKFKFNYKIYIKIMRCKIVRFQKFM